MKTTIETMESRSQYRAKLMEDRVRKPIKLSIDRCPVHKEFWAISVGDESGGTRLTPGKCCGRWNEVKSFVMSRESLLEAADEITNYAEKAAEKR